MTTPAFLPCGEQALSVELGDSIDPETNATVIALSRNLADAPVEGVVETVPTYRSLLVRYDPGTIRGDALEKVLTERVSSLNRQQGAARLWRIPVAYGGEAGCDLDDLAAQKEIDTEELIRLHSEAAYRVYMIGFAPGFAYLGGLPEILHTPRLAQPRQNIAAGAIGIGGQQASINSVAGPSGWRFIGQTPVRTFDPAREVPFLLAAGDEVRFERIAADEAERMSAEGYTPEPEAAT
ncbi:sensor histidine kinase inhibitor, KipI family [Tranquillimonas rosea]|uniref:Sensor histidine kinase inhibitor, KipI family n=1 Tax=Tranquillimonas rosea TaxID=641238 RepID=A0A1H9WIE9_9RHOB|nr:5-oxoprolinase subunit PxpB [Tranquillimonas rosea]SES33645.1 sensor histidine kinase inhibitor, KipI family [Tranquillimonas rosea]